jgi:xylulokinase
MQTVLGIDLGTQSLKTLFYDYESHRVAAVTSAPLELMRDERGTAEQDASWWLDALRKSLAKVPDRVRASVRAIGVSGQQHGLVALDRAGHVLVPVKLWCDTSTQQEVDEITQAVGGRERCIAISGNAMVTGYTAPKIRWLKKQHPTLYREAAHFLLPHDYLNWTLTGVLCMEHGDASGSGLMDVRERSWSNEMLRAVDTDRNLATCLPPFAAADEFIGTTTEASSKRFGLPVDTPVSVGGGDNMMGAIGTGNVSAGALTMSLGSSGTLYAHSDVPIVDPEGNIAAFCGSTGGWLPLLCTMNCTLATELMRAPLGVDLDALDAHITPVEPGSGGLLVLPFFNGERTPNLPNARGTILGLGSGTSSKGHLLRATVEGVTYALKFGIDELSRLGLAAGEIILIGGGAKSRAWRQIVADICGLPVMLLEHEEGPSFGAALQSLWVLQRQTDPSLGIRDITAEHIARDEASGAMPNPAHQEAYARAYGAYQRAVAQIAPFY